MTKTNSGDLVNRAKERKTAVIGFNVITLEYIEAIIFGAEETQLPLILQISENCIKFHGDFLPIGSAAIAAAHKSSVPISVHLDHCEDFTIIQEALDIGFDSIMFDGSKLPFSENVSKSKKMANLCHQYGATLEVEIGEIGGKDGNHAIGARTDPEVARKFVNEVEADLVAVAVGSSHAMNTRDATLDFELISTISKMVNIPLVLHGSSGVSDSDLVKASEAGISKVNISTLLNKSFTEQIRRFLIDNNQVVDPRKYLSVAKDSITTEVIRLLKMVSE